MTSHFATLRSISLTLSEQWEQWEQWNQVTCSSSHFAISPLCIVQPACINPVCPKQSLFPQIKSNQYQANDSIRSLQVTLHCRWFAALVYRFCSIFRYLYVCLSVCYAYYLLTLYNISSQSDREWVF